MQSARSFDLNRLKRAARLSLLVLSSLIVALTLGFLWVRFQFGIRKPGDYEAYVAASALAFRHALLPTLGTSLALFWLRETWLSTRRLKSEFFSGLAFLSVLFAAMAALGWFVSPDYTFPKETWLAAWAVAITAFSASEFTRKLDSQATERVLYNRPIQLLVDAVLVAASLIIAYLVRFDTDVPARFVTQFFTLLPFAIVAQLAVHYFWGVYLFIWRFTSLKEAIVIGQSVASLALVAIVVRLVFLQEFQLLRVPLGVLLMQPLLAYAGFLGVRVLRRIQYQEQFRRNPTHGSDKAKRILLVGAGHAGQILLREMENKPDFQVVGFLDDDPRKRRRTIHGVRVLGKTEDLRAVTEELEVDEVTLCMPSPPREVVRRIVAGCEASGINVTTIPSLSEIISGKVSISRLRPVRMEDLLRRAAIAYAIDDQQLLWNYRGKSILVTGAAGSIGSELVRQLREFKPSRLILLDKDENGIYEVGMETSHEIECEMVQVIADIRDPARLQSVFTRYRPQVVFHAAAYKHVPLMENHPCEAILNNVIGSRNLVDLAFDFGIDAFVLISTDKAVNPTNVMGASKRIAERIVQEKASRCRENGPRFCCVRFGNVLGSRASVVPLFQKQIKEGRNITVTHPEVQRYFMTIPEAVQLVIQAGSLGQHGEIFVLDMGDPVRIVDLARDLIELSGLKLGRDIDIEFTGLRPGEKLFEELLVGEENGIRDTRYPKIFVGQAVRDRWPELELQLGQLEEAARRDDAEAIRDLLRGMDIGFGEEVPAVPQSR